MERHEQQDAPLELGAASTDTLGGPGEPTDLVRGIPQSVGISDD